MRVMLNNNSKLINFSFICISSVCKYNSKNDFTINIVSSILILYNIYAGDLQVKNGCCRTCRSASSCSILFTRPTNRCWSLWCPQFIFKAAEPDVSCILSIKACLISKLLRGLKSPVLLTGLLLVQVIVCSISTLQHIVSGALSCYDEAQHVVVHLPGIARGTQQPALQLPGAETAYRWAH